MKVLDLCFLNNVWPNGILEQKNVTYFLYMQSDIIFNFHSILNINILGCKCFSE